MYLRDYYVENTELSSVFWEWTEKKQDAFLETLKAWFADMGKRHALKRMYEVAMERIQDEDGQLDFLVSDVEQFFKAGEQGAFLWIVRKDGTSLIDLNCLRFDSKGNWTSRMYFEALIGYGGRRDYYVFNKTDGFKAVDEEFCFKVLLKYEQEAKKRRNTLSEEDRLNKLNQQWQDNCSIILKPSRIEIKRLRDKGTEKNDILSETLSEAKEVKEVIETKPVDANVVELEELTFRKCRSKSLWDLEQDEIEGLNQTRLACTSHGQVWISFALDDVDEA